MPVVATPTDNESCRICRGERWLVSGWNTCRLITTCVKFRIATRLAASAKGYARYRTSAECTATPRQRGPDQPEVPAGTRVRMVRRATDSVARSCDSDVEISTSVALALARPSAFLSPASAAYRS
jgi:hypothetical protein